MKSYGEILSQAVFHGGQIFISFDRDISDGNGEEIVDPEAIDIMTIMMENGHDGPLLQSPFNEVDFTTLAFYALPAKPENPMEIGSLVRLRQVREYLNLYHPDGYVKEGGANMETINNFLVQQASPDAPKFMLESAADKGRSLYRVIEARYKWDGEKVVALFDGPDWRDNPDW